VWLEGSMPCALTVIQMGVGLLRAEPKAKDGVLLVVTLLRSRQHTCRTVCACSLSQTLDSQNLAGLRCWPCTCVRSGLASVPLQIWSSCGHTCM
jgi:hypothetical protein